MHSNFIRSKRTNLKLEEYFKDLKKRHKEDHLSNLLILLMVENTSINHFQYDAFYNRYRDSKHKADDVVYKSNESNLMNKRYLEMIIIQR